MVYDTLKLIDKVHATLKLFGQGTWLKLIGYGMQYIKINKLKYVKSEN